MEFQGTRKRKPLRNSSLPLSLGKTYAIDFAKACNASVDAAKECGLELKKYDIKDENNWYGTAATYLDLFAANSLRLIELRIGHNNIP